MMAARIVKLGDTSLRYRLYCAFLVVVICGLVWLVYDGRFRIPNGPYLPAQPPDRSFSEHVIKLNNRGVEMQWEVPETALQLYNEALAADPSYHVALANKTQLLISQAKHPNIVDVESAGGLVRQFGQQTGINEAAAGALKNIMRTGSRTEKMTKAFGRVVEFKLPSGLGARFSADTGEFLGFLGRGVQ